ncbi:MAG: hypothetical protein ACREOG_06875, partial [Gemmatimonadaceae bacterium]
VRFPHAPATRSSTRRPRCLTLRAALVCSVLLLPQLAPAQRTDTVRTTRDTAVTPAPRSRAGVSAQQPRNVQPPISARKAFLYSFAMPGLGQSSLRRPTAGAFYFGLEMLSIAMAIKSHYDLRLAKDRSRDSVVLRYELDATGLPVIDSATGEPKVAEFARNRYDAERIRARRTHFEDWIAVLVFNHLFSGADAFVSAQLWDLPTQVGFEPAPSGGVALALRVRF